MSETKCGACESCLDDGSTGMSNPARNRMILCATCGNKRCPHATDHANACTRSNAPGQAGSSYEGCGTPEERDEYMRSEALVRTERARASHSQLSRDVRTFMAAAGQALPDKPAVPDDATVRLRLRLIAEEFCELLDACGCDGGEVDMLRDRASDAIDSREESATDFPEVADALADLRYVIVGSDAAFGIDGDAIDRVVHASNMSKTPFTMRPDGKVVKAAGFIAPDIAGELRRQGWEG